MSGCTDPKSEAMIHGYELGILSEDEVREFEMHVLDCESCFEEVRDMLPTSILLRHDSDVLTASAETVRKKPGFSRLLLIAAVLLVVSVPIYRYVQRTPDIPPTVQQLEFFPLRSPRQQALDLDVGGEAAFIFVVDGAGPASILAVNIRPDGGEPLFVDDRFTGFDSAGRGQITLPVDSFVRGFYILTIADTIETSLFEPIEYPFRVD